MDFLFPARDRLCEGNDQQFSGGTEIVKPLIIREFATGLALVARHFRPGLSG